MASRLIDSASPSLRAVFFDLAGTLIHVRGSIGLQYAEIARQFGVRADAEAIDRAFPRAFGQAGQMVFPHPDAAEVASLEKGFWKKVVRFIFTETGAIAQFAPGRFDCYFDRLFEYFAGAEGWDVYPDVLPTLQRLKKAQLTVGLITNFDYRVFPLIESLHLGQFIDSITIPALARTAKPDNGIFEYALARHGLRPAEAVQVGDSLEDDVEGARAAGLQAVLLERKSRGGASAALPRINSLEELFPMFRLRP